MLLVKADKNSEAGVMPPKELFAEMGKFNEEMAKAGVMLAAEGLQPTSKGARISYTRGKPKVTDGPFPDTKDLVAGFWLVQVKSKQEAIDWASRAPFGEGAEVEIRQVFETSDFPPEVFSAEDAAREQALRDQVQRRISTA
jgi:hypothetical protein